MKTNQNSILPFLLLLIISGGCTKEEITEVTEVTQVIDNNIELITWAQNEDADVLFIDITSNQADFDINDRLVDIPIGALNPGDKIIAETSVRLRKDQNGADCNSDMFVQTGSRLSTAQNDLPGSAEGIPAANGNLGFIQEWHKDISYTFFTRTIITEIDSSYNQVYASFWVSTYTSNSGCQAEDAVRLQLGHMKLTIERAE